MDEDIINIFKANRYSTFRNERECRYCLLEDNGVYDEFETIENLAKYIISLFEERTEDIKPTELYFNYNVPNPPIGMHVAGSQHDDHGLGVEVDFNKPLTETEQVDLEKRIIIEVKESKLFKKDLEEE